MTTLNANVNTCVMSQDLEYSKSLFSFLFCLPLNCLLYTTVWFLLQFKTHSSIFKRIKKASSFIFLNKKQPKMQKLWSIVSVFIVFLKQKKNKGQVLSKFQGFSFSSLTLSGHPTCSFCLEGLTLKFFNKLNSVDDVNLKASHNCIVVFVLHYRFCSVLLCFALFLWNLKKKKKPCFYFLLHCVWEKRWTEATITKKNYGKTRLRNHGTP